MFSCRQILKLVVLTMLGTLVGWYLAALGAFAGNTYGFNNRFTEVAIRDHWMFLIWSNVVVLKGYLLVALGFIAVLWPLVCQWQAWQPVTRRRHIVLRTAILAGLGYGAFIVRLIQDRPYFGDFSYMAVFVDWMGPDARWWLSGMVSIVVPSMALIIALLWYLRQGGWSLRSRSTVLGSALIVTGICAAAAFGLSKQDVAALTGTAPKPQPKNILIIGSDSLRAGNLSCNGHDRPTSPNIDQLAAGGVNFTQCLTPIASTFESLTSLFSSQYPHTHGVQHMFPNKETIGKVNAQSPSLGGTLRAQGYDTAVIGDWCACVFNELPMGFDEVVVSDFDNFRIYMSEVVYLHHQILPLFFDNRIGHALFPKMRSFANYMTPDVVTEQVIDRIEARAQDSKPFLLFAYYSCTHLPYKTPRQYSALWTDPDYAGPHQHELALNVDEFIGSTDINEKWSKFPPQEVAQVRALYDGTVRMFDDCVGRIVEKLKREGLFDNTVILITGDHGDDLFEPGVTFGHGLTFNGGDQTNHVPAVLHIPGLDTPGQRITPLSRTIDFAPTLCDLVGIPADARFEGRSLMPLLTGKKSTLDLAFFGETSYLFFKRHIEGEQPLHIPAMDETTFIDPTFDYHFVLKPKYEADVLRTKERCLRTQRFKLVSTPGVNGAILRLFDLTSDPHCERDVKHTFPEVAQRMERALTRWTKDKQESTIREILGDIDEAEIVARP
jgi:arylsulfatase A-like enzyme